VRALTQDDCHIFCTEEQIQEEFSRCLHLVTEVLETYGLTDYRVQLSLPAARGNMSTTRRSGRRQSRPCARRSTPTASPTMPPRARRPFYGPKADFMAKDALGREWQLSTIQVDFIQPARLGCEYIGEDSAAHTPVVLHRAVTGSTERFLGVIIEHFAGAFPVWLAPVQAKLIPIADRHLPYMQEVAAKLAAAGIRAEVDSSNNRMNNKIRAAQVQKIPYMLVAGDRDIEGGAVSVRLRSEEQLGAMKIDDFIAFITPIIETKSLDLKEARAAKEAAAVG
jgi:threonyl-tRNA synthetase